MFFCSYYKWDCFLSYFSDNFSLDREIPLHWIHFLDLTLSRWYIRAFYVFSVKSSAEKRWLPFWFRCHWLACLISLTRTSIARNRKDETEHLHPVPHLRKNKQKTHFLHYLWICHRKYLSCWPTFLPYLMC